MKVKTRAKAIKILVEPEDVRRFGGAVVNAMVNAMLQERPDLLRPVEAWTLELEGRMVITLHTQGPDIPEK